MNDVFSFSIVTIVFVFVIILTIIKAVSRYHDRTLRHKERLIAIEKGLPIPMETPAPCKKPRNSHDSRGTGLILLFVGVGIFFSFMALSYVVGHIEAMAGGVFGLIPLFIGVGFLIDAYLLGREEKKEEASNQDKKKEC